MEDIQAVPHRRSSLERRFVQVAILAGFVFFGFLLLDGLEGELQFSFQQIKEKEASESMESSEFTVIRAIRINNETRRYEYYALRSEDDSALKTCVLKEFPDGWTDEAVSIVNTVFDPLANCNRSYKPLTEFVDGRVRLVHEENETILEQFACRARPILWQKDLDYTTGEWVDISENHTFTHDAVHVQCARGSTNFTEDQISYSFAHLQIYRNNSTEINSARAVVAEREKKRAVRPSVHVILLDSLGNSAMLRTMPRTVGFLEGKLGAVNFRHVNKVGANSRPNGAALLLGMQLADFDRSLLGLPSVPADYNSSFFCEHLDLDKQKIVIREFEKQRGYVTMLSDDWSQGVFNFPGCKGYQKMPATHYNRPYQLLSERDKAVAARMSVKNCMKPWMAQLQYLEQFSKTYSDLPKASLSWITTLAHDNNEDAFTADDIFYDFLQRNREEFANSFVFFMSDHGMRWGKISSSDIGTVERNSAALFLSVPRWLRNNRDLMKNMRKNSGKLLTQFDVHATLVDLVETLPTTNFTNFATLPTNNSELRGSSLFRPLPVGPRNCFTLPIPFEFCMCNLEFVDVNETFVKRAVEKSIVTRINQLIGVRNLTALCQKIAEAKATSVKAIKGTNGLFRVRVLTTPGGGDFEAWLRDVGARGSPFFIAASASLSRLNEYGKAADCLESTGTEDMRPLCYCKPKGR